MSSTDHLWTTDWPKDIIEQYQLCSFTRHIFVIMKHYWADLLPIHSNGFLLTKCNVDTAIVRRRITSKFEPKKGKLSGFSSFHSTKWRTIDTLNELSYETLPHPYYYLLLSDYHFFKYIDSYLWELFLKSKAEVETAFDDFIVSRTSGFYAIGINDFWLEKCSEFNGFYQH